MRRGQGSTLALLLASLLCASCTQRAPTPTGVFDCPLLVVPGATYGGLASIGRFVEGRCVELFAPNGERVALTHVGAGGAFAFQFSVAGDASGGEFTLRVTAEATGEGESLTLRFATVSDAEIVYPADTTPLIATGSDLRFTGSLELTGGAGIRSAVMVNWSRSLVRAVSPTPVGGVTFTSTVPGGRGDCGAVISRHMGGGGGGGGCWWPRGGGGCCSRCTLEEFRAGTCPRDFGVGTGCTRGRGCGILDVDERLSGAAPPETNRSIPVLPPPPDPIDVGPPDAFTPDAPGPDAGEDAMVF